MRYAIPSGETHPHVAMGKGTPLVPGAPEGKDELVVALRAAAEKLDAVGRLRTYGVAPRILEAAESKKNHFFLLELDAAEMQLNITGYKSKDMDDAASAYLAAETRFAQAAAGGDAVLVSVESLAALRRAYALKLHAADAEDAKARLNSLIYGRVLGEVAVSLPASLGPFASLLCSVRNAFQR